MKEFLLAGSMRLVGSLGIVSRFARTVSAESESAAKDKVRDHYYGLGYEHVHVHEIVQIRKEGEHG